MGTVSKALGLIDLLQASSQPLGLTGIARRAGFDKATTRRLLLELVANGYVEQDPETRDYSLGPALQALGRAREQRFPLYRALEPSIRALAERTGETVHAAEFCAGTLSPIVVIESTKANRVILESGLKLPLHATASGIAFLAASPDSFIDQVCRRVLARYTGATTTDAEALRRIVAETRQRGFSLSDQSFEAEVSSVAAAIRSASGKPVGTIAVAMPTSRMTPEIAFEFGALVKAQAEEVSARLFGKANGEPLRKAS